MHLHDGASVERESLRADQIAAVLAWMSAREADADGGCVLLGDLNAAPHEKAHELLSAHGFAVRCGQTRNFNRSNSSLTFCGKSFVFAKSKAKFGSSISCIILVLSRINSSNAFSTPII